MTTRSLLLMKYQDGIVRHAAYFHGVANATSVAAPWVAQSSRSREAGGTDR